MTSAPTPAPSSPLLPLTTTQQSVLHIKRRTAQGIATLAVRYGLVIGINLVGTIALSRRLGPSLWGVFAIVQLIYLSSQEVLGRGLASYLIKKDGPPTVSDVRSTFALQNLLGLSALVGTVLAAGPVARWYGHDELHGLLMAAAVASYGYACRSVPLALLERDFDYVKVAMIEVLENVVFYVASISLVWMGHIAAGLAVAVVLRSWIPTFLAFGLKPVRPVLRFHFTDMAAIADFGFSVAAGSLVNIAVFSVPAIFVGKLSGMKELGKAQMALSLYGNLLFVTAAVVRLNLSAYSRLIEHSAAFVETVNQHLQMLAAFLVPAIVLFAGLAPVWTVLVFGQKWQGLPAVLLAQAPGYLLAAVFWGVLNPALLVSGRHRHVLSWLMGFTVLLRRADQIAESRMGGDGCGHCIFCHGNCFSPVAVLDLWGRSWIPQIRQDFSRDRNWRRVPGDDVVLRWAQPRGSNCVCPGLWNLVALPQPKDFETCKTGDKFC